MNNYVWPILINETNMGIAKPTWGIIIRWTVGTHQVLMMSDWVLIVIPPFLLFSYIVGI